MSKLLLKVEYFLLFWITVQQNRDGKQKDAQLQIIIICDWGMKFCGLVDEGRSNSLRNGRQIINILKWWGRILTYPYPWKNKISAFIIADDGQLSHHLLGIGRCSLEWWWRDIFIERIKVTLIWLICMFWSLWQYVYNFMSFIILCYCPKKSQCWVVVDSTKHRLGS